MIPGKEKVGLKISPVIEKIPGGKKGIKIIGIKLGFDLKQLQVIIKEIQHKKL